MTHQEYSYDVALSYVTEDKAYADELYKELHQRDLRVFFKDEEEEQAYLWGKHNTEAIPDVYRRSRYCILLFSQHYLQHSQRHAETRSDLRFMAARASLEVEEFILPVRLDQADISQIIQIPNTVESLDWSAETPERIARKLLHKLGRLPAQRAAQIASSSRPQPIPAPPPIPAMVHQLTPRDGKVREQTASEPRVDQDSQTRLSEAERLIREGDAFSKKAYYDRALSAYDKALQILPNSIAALCGRGNSFRCLRYLPEALDAYKQALRLAPNIPYIYCQIGHVLLESKNYLEALECYKRAIRLQESAETQTFIGIALKMQGNYSGALKALERALRLDERYVSAHANMGLLCVEIADYRRAQTHFIRAIQLGGRDASIYQGLGRVWMSWNALDEALVAFEEALQLDPSQELIYMDKGDVLCRKGRYEEAVATYDRGIELHPESSFLYIRRGSALEELGNVQKARTKKMECYEEALKAYKVVVYLGRNGDIPWSMIGNVLLKLGRRAEADDAFEQARRKRPL